MNTLTDPTQPNAQRSSLRPTLYLLPIVLLGAGWWVDRTCLKDEMKRLSEQKPVRELSAPPPNVDTPLVLKQAYFGRTQVLEFLIHNKVIEKPVPEYPPIRELADRTFDESQLPSLWKDARARCPGTKCVGYYFTLDEGGKVDANLRGPAFFVITVDGKVAGFWDNVLW